MKNNDYWFIKKETRLPLWASILLFCVTVMSLKRLVDVQRVNTSPVKELGVLRASQVHVWIMDPSAGDQLLTSGVIRLKIK